MRINLKNGLVIVLTTVFAVSLLVSQSIAKKNMHSSKIQAVQVDVYKVPAPHNMPVVLEYPARLKSVQKVQITARVTGTLIKKFYTEGQFVKKGTLLYKIEPDTYQAAVDAAKAQLQSALAMLNKTKRDWVRIKSLYKVNATSQQARDAALSSYEIAKADVEKAKANLKSALINLNYTNVKATISGITGLKSADVGSLVTNGTPLVSITKLDPIYAEFSIPDIDIIKEKYRIKNGSWEKPSDGKIKAVIKINGRGYPKEGFVNFMDTNIDTATSTLKARAVFPNHNRYLMPGEFVKIMLKGLVRKNVIMVPQRCVLQNPLGTMVFVVDKGKVQARPVKLGETSGNYYIIEKGLKKGDLVIVDNFFRVKPGMSVKVDKTINREQ